MLSDLGGAGVEIGFGEGVVKINLGGDVDK